jgi:uroporphyrinogen decarboxylase
MTSRELVIKTLNHEPVPRIPRDLWLPVAEEVLRPDEVSEINLRYPGDIVHPEVAPVQGKKTQAKPNKSGEFTDAWGCGWRIALQDPAPQLISSPLSEAGKIAAFQPPADLLDRNRFAKVNKSCQATNRFVLAWSEVRPFDRLRFLRGETTLVDLARGTKDIRSLLAMLHDFACKEIDMWAKTDVDGVAIRDDWGTADGLLVSTEMWRDLFRPLYRDYCKILHAHDKFVFFHSDGNVIDILGELIKLGVDAVHLQMHIMDVERLAKRYRGRVTFWGGMDPQRLREPGSSDEFHKAVLAIRKALDFGAGGVIAQCQWEPGMKLQTIASFFEQWLIPLSMHG